MRIFLLRHGETAWTKTLQHTSHTDLSLTKRGEEEAQALTKRLRGNTFEKVFSSPLQRVRQTCAFAGLAEQAEYTDDLVEWDYGDYEGKTTKEIRQTVPDWTIFTHGAPGGESEQEVAARADRFFARCRSCKGDIAVFTSGHFGRVLGARWIGFSAKDGRYLLLSTASYSILGYEREVP
ncbi:histidine phosphatase family protein, partial [Simkania negevensis]|nr:histidine phosphatase family protein [Simkania negevensis]